MLLTGARGTGKSSLIKALLNKYAPQGLRLIEVDKQDLIDLPDIVDLIAERPERFILFCDDLSFEADEPGYKALKVVLDGSIAAASDNCLIYATSNRRHLMPEYMQENLEYQARRRGDPSGRDRRGEDLAVRALRAVGVVLSVRPGRVPDDRRRTGSRTSACPARAREAAHKAALQWALSAARAAAASRGSSRATGQGEHRMSSGATHVTESGRRAAAMMQPAVEVVAAVLQRADGSFLLAQRPAGKVYAGYWEFPGGKVEPGEPRRRALARELHEELGIDVRARLAVAHARLRLCARHVRLHFFRVVDWRGEPHAARRPGACLAAHQRPDGSTPAAGQRARPPRARAADASTASPAQPRSASSSFAGARSTPRLRRLAAGAGPRKDICRESRTPTARSASSRGSRTCAADVLINGEPNSRRAVAARRRASASAAA